MRNCWPDNSNWFYDGLFELLSSDTKQIQSASATRRHGDPQAYDHPGSHHARHGADGGLPLYQQLQRALREAIDKRILGPDEEALPAERQLASDLAVSRITVRKAIDGLVNEGLLVRRPSSGNFINTRIEKNFAKLTSFPRTARARGRTPRSVWLKRSREPSRRKKPCACGSRRAPPSTASTASAMRTRCRCAGIRHHRGRRYRPRCRPTSPCTTRWNRQTPPRAGVQRLRRCFAPENGDLLYRWRRRCGPVGGAATGFCAMDRPWNFATSYFRGDM